MTHNAVTADTSCKLAGMISTLNTMGIMLSLDGSHDKKDNNKHDGGDRVENEGIFNLY